VLNECVVGTSAIENDAALGIRHKENILMTKWYLKSLRDFLRGIYSVNILVKLYLHIMCTAVYRASSGKGWYF